MKLLLKSLTVFCLLGPGWLRAEPSISYDYPYSGSFIVNHETSPLMYSGVLGDRKPLIDYLLLEQQYTDHFIHQHYDDFHSILSVLASSQEFLPSEDTSGEVEVPALLSDFVYDVVFDETHPCGRVFAAPEPCFRCDRSFMEVVKNRTKADRFDDINYDLLFEGDSENCIRQWSDNGHNMLVIVEKDHGKQLLRLNAETKQVTPIQTHGVELGRQGKWTFIPEYYGFYIVSKNPAVETTYHLRNDSNELTLVIQKTIEGMENAQITVIEEQVTATDGTEIPVTIVGLSDVIKSQGKQPSPMVLSVYGGYGVVNEPFYNSAFAYLISKGITIAYAHVRGGGKPGATYAEQREWRKAGQYLHLETGFQDFIDVVKGLISRGITAPDRLVATGTSWGGMNVGYAINQHPELFAAAVLKVPSVEPRLRVYESDDRLCRVEGIGAIANISTNERVCGRYEDDQPSPETRPLEEALAYKISPYENIHKGPYPHILITTGLEDENVLPWEPARYHNKIRHFAEPGKHLFLFSDMEGNHHTRSERQKAFEALFVLDVLGKLGESLTYD